MVYELVWERDRGFCVLCSLQGQRIRATEMHHIIPRSRCVGRYRYLREDVRNVAMLCRLCHHPSPSREEKRLMLCYLRDTYGYTYDEPPFKEALGENDG